MIRKLQYVRQHPVRQHPVKAREERDHKSGRSDENTNGGEGN